MLLDNKNAIIYGAGGSIGGAVAKECAREGASVFLTGRKRENLETVAKETQRPVGPPRSPSSTPWTRRPSRTTLGLWPPEGAASTCPSTSSRAETCRGSRWSR